MLKNIFKIYRSDLKNLFSNYAAIITIGALCILPSLYAWFNIAASWNPYAQEATSQIKIGVINEDSGSEIRGKEINIGDSIVESLEENDLMGWIFLDENKAEDMIRKGKLYATITIPSEFSKQITSIITEDIQKGDIIYKVNEKINAIAPKLTDKGASGVQENISKTFVETVGNAILSAAKDVGIELENVKPKISNVYNMLKEIQSKFSDINETVDLAADGAVKIKDLSKDLQDDIPLIQETLNNSRNLTSQLKEFISSSKKGLSELSPTIKEDIRLLSEISSDISDYCKSIIDAINSGSENAPEILDNLINKVNTLQKVNSSLLKVLNALNKFSPKLDSIIEKLNNINTNIASLKLTLSTIKDELAAGSTVDTSLLTNMKTFTDSISSITSNIYSRYDSEIVPNINSILDNTYNTSDNVLSVLEEADKKLPAVSSLLDTAYTGSDKGIEVINYAKEKLPKAEEIINLLVEKMGKVNDDESMQEFVDLLKKDVEARSDFLANPVNLVEEKLFPMGNYGTAMTPFYTTLCLWVGPLLLVSILSVDPHEIVDEDNKMVTFSPTESYFGKLLFFVSICIIQGIIVALGDLFYLKIYCVHPVYLVLSSILTSIVFVVIVYTACSVFGNVGKVLSIILLVIQIGGSGGTFPIELTPRFFQRIHPVLPFTYAISLMRESIGGIVVEVVTKDLALIACFIVAAILVGIFLKKPFSNIINKFSKKFEESHLGE